MIGSQEVEASGGRGPDKIAGKLEQILSPHVLNFESSQDVQGWLVVYSPSDIEGLSKSKPQLCEGRDLRSGGRDIVRPRHASVASSLIKAITPTHPVQAKISIHVVNVGCQLLLLEETIRGLVDWLVFCRVALANPRDFPIVG